MHRIREIAIQGANGVYSKEQTSYLATEVNELLQQLLQIANSKGEDGLSYFAGFLNYNDAFRILKGPVPGAEGEKITTVEYIGNIGTNKVEISEGETMAMNIPGNYAFWAENQRITSSVEASE